MKSKIYILLLFFLLNACRETRDHNSFEHSQSKIILVDSNANEPIGMSENIKPTNKITFPTIGDFSLSSMKQDSTHEYGGGDCEGQITRYSIDQIALGVDSLFCGEYGYTFTHYLLNTHNNVQAVHSIKCEWNVNPDKKNSSVYILTEKIIDFNTDTAKILIRIDTLFEYNVSNDKYPEPSNKAFTVETTKDQKSLAKKVELEYMSQWDADLLH